MKKYTGTIEFLPGQRAAIVVLTDSNGEWAGATRVERGSRNDLYEAGYDVLDGNATDKGGRLETYRIIS